MVGHLPLTVRRVKQKAKVVRVAKALRYLFSGASTVTTVRTLNGKMETGDAATLKNLIRAANADHRLVSGIRLNSPGGSLGEGAKLAEIIRYGKIATVVPSGAQCASACFLIFATGPEKYASCTANVCVHGASNRSGLEEGSATISMGRAIKELGIPGNIIGKMVITPPDQIVWLAPNDLRSMGTALTGKPSQVPLAEQTSSQMPLQLDLSKETSTADTGPLNLQELVRGAFALSQQQNGGRADVRAMVFSSRKAMLAIAAPSFNASSETLCYQKAISLRKLSCRRLSRASSSRAQAELCP